MTDEQGNIQRDLGRIEGRLQAQEDRLDKTEQLVVDSVSKITKKMETYDIKLDGISSAIISGQAEKGFVKRLQDRGWDLFIALIGGGVLLALLQRFYH